MNETQAVNAPYTELERAVLDRIAEHLESYFHDEGSILALQAADAIRSGDKEKIKRMAEFNKIMLNEVTPPDLADNKNFVCLEREANNRVLYRLESIDDALYAAMPMPHSNCHLFRAGLFFSGIKDDDGLKMLRQLRDPHGIMYY